MRRVVVTGMGVVSPLGVGIDAFWDGLIHGRSGVRRITRFDPSPYPSQIAGEVPDFDAAAHLPRRDIVRTDTFIQYALIAAQAALRDSGVKIDGQNERVGVSIGTGMGGVPLLLSSWETLRREGMPGVSAYALPGSLPNMAAGWVSMRTVARGPLYTPTTACAASTQAVGDAFRAIQRGDADVMLAGGTDSLIHPLVIAGFSAIRALSTRNDEPTLASRPFDKDRDGFVLAEGAGVLVLEPLEAARARGARIYAEVLGYGLSRRTPITPRRPRRTGRPARCGSPWPTPSSPRRRSTTSTPTARPPSSTTSTRRRRSRPSSAIMPGDWRSARSSR